ncbi:DMT family transporter [Peribacillus loiseleuriae]|uniref:Multidrug resistance protein SMR n=1 Tax=Peribacillus loiseleuriae TaxID=1679170 RepID=A0A0K9GXB3_9BACI|nr:multidrug efflux SMR transporter [Peribacillus loiseleuriae]KMY51339.1 multidrug resistance protein SMR [Peribacillus loiseleuriae]
MNINWIYVLLAGILEIVWVSGLKYSNNILEWVVTGATIVVSFIVLVKATKHLPIGTVYAVFTGIGTAGTVIVEMVVFGEPFKLLKMILVGTLICGVIGLKMLTNDEEGTKVEGGKA